ncbi:MAG: hypothetical protein P8P48_05580 [Saprospiraceae bacterium]|nr:hypothetical protein [Saprospiraceae bacterium]
MDTFLEIVKITIPALVVFLSVYFIMKKYLDQQYQLQLLDFKKDRKNTTTPLKLQSYERLSLFCERISIPNLVLRIKTKGASSAALRVSLLMAVQQEFEHNISQQIYISDQLWEIIKLARTETIELVNSVSEKIDPKADSDELANALIAVFSSMNKSATQTALMAIRQEAALMI